MINFCLTNDLSLSTRKYPNYIDLYNGFSLGYEEDVEVHETKDVIVLLCGIMWENDIDQFVNLDGLVPNGLFYAIRYDKYKQKVTVITDFIETFAVYYYAENDKVIISNKLISFSNKFFTINQDWVTTAINGVYVDRKLISYENIPNWMCHNGYPSDTWYSGITPINNVKMVGPGAFFTIDLATCKTSHTLYYDARRDYVDLAYDVTKKLTFDEITGLSDIILRKNIDKIYKKYNKRLIPSICNGIDGIHIASMLGDRINDLKVVGYTGDWFVDEPPNRLIKLYENFPKGELSIMDKKTYDSIYYEVNELHCDMPIMNPSLMPEVVRWKDKFPNAVYLKGSFGDEIFWHDGNSGLVAAIHELGARTLDEAKKMLEPYYVCVPYIYSERLFDYYKSKTLLDGMLSYHYYRQKVYMRDELPLYDQLIVSPYVDIRLRQMMPLADHDARIRNMLDAESQKVMIDKKWLNHINPHKGGMEESHTFIDRLKCTRHMLKFFLKKWYNS